MTLNMCVNYGGRNELTDAVRSIADEVAAGRLKPSGITEKVIQRHLYQPQLPDVDLFVRSSGEQRTSNFQLWESAYAEMVFLDRLWPDFTRGDLWEAIDLYTGRGRRFGGAVDAPEPARLEPQNVTLAPRKIRSARPEELQRQRPVAGRGGTTRCRTRPPCRAAGTTSTTRRGTASPRSVL